MEGVPPIESKSAVVLRRGNVWSMIKCLNECLTTWLLCMNETVYEWSIIGKEMGVRQP